MPRPRLFESIVDSDFDDSPLGRRILVGVGGAGSGRTGWGARWGDVFFCFA